MQCIEAVLFYLSKALIVFVFGEGKKNSGVSFDGRTYKRMNIGSNRLNNKMLLNAAMP